MRFMLGFKLLNCINDLFFKIPSEESGILICFRQQQFKRSTEHEKYLLHLKSSLNLKKKILSGP